MKLDNLKINILGDSITEGRCASSSETSYVGLLQKKYPNAVIRNYGVCGSCLSDKCLWGVRSFCERADEMDPDADLVFVFGGTNDYGHGDAPMGTMNDRTPYTFYGALHTLYTALISRFPEALIVVMTPLHRLNENALVDENGRRRAGTLRDYVNAIREVAEYYSLPVLDLYKESGMQPNVPVIQEMYIPDGLHPNDAGHEVLKNMIYSFLKSR